jgi:hypothetical protein
MEKITGQKELNMCNACNDSGKIVIPSGSLTYFGPCLICDIHIQNKKRADGELREMLEEVQGRIRKRDQAMELRRKMLVYDLQAAGADKDVPDKTLDELEPHELERLAVKYEIVPRVS